MDILLSLPIVSYFLTPGATSLSTSLNLLFFYMTWTTLVVAYPPLQIEIAGMLAIRLIFWLVPSLAFLAFDTALPSLAENLKIGGAEALPPRDAQLLGRQLALATVNLLLEAVVQAVVSVLASLLLAIPLRLPRLPRLWGRSSSSGWTGSWGSGWSNSWTSGWTGSSNSWTGGYGIKGSNVWTGSGSSWASAFRPRPLFKTSSTLPLPWAIFKQIVLLIALREVLTYYIHRFVLSRPSSARSRTVRRLSTWHTTNPAHTRQAPPYSLLLFADHPASFFLHRFVPLYAAALIVRPHLLVLFGFVALVTVEETMALSGYSVVPGILLRGIARRTTSHYSSSEGGKDEEGAHNFGAWGLLDWAHGTSSARSVVQDVQAEAEKHDVRKKLDVKKLGNKSNSSDNNSSKSKSSPKKQRRKA